MTTKSKGVSKLPLPKISGLAYQQRVAAIFDRLADNSVAIIVSNPEQTRSNDTTFPYRPSSDMLYINGFPEPECAVALVKATGKANRTIMFVRSKDPSQEIWTGVRFGVSGARKNFHSNEAYTVDEFEKVVAGLLKKAENVYYRFGVHSAYDAKFNRLWQVDQRTLLNPESIIHEMRLFKSEEEFKLLQHAADISVAAHIKAMQTARPGVYEFEVQAAMEEIFTARGAAFPAYSSIEACGNNACTLHYVTNRTELAGGELMLIDAACEYEGYAADITRTFPVNGKFTQAQREVYELVLKAQEAGIRASRAGSTLRHVHSVTSAVLRRGLVDLGILGPEMRTRASALATIKAAKKAGTLNQLLKLSDVFPHGTSHMLGLDVHDVGLDRGRKGKGTDRTLEVGMCFTVEPGLYLNKNDKRVPKKYRGIGIRIEDDILITADGAVNLSAGVPKSVEDIERTMAEGAAARS